MITSVRLVNFKNFADETLKVGPFTVIVGANASGKSNIRDAFRFLHGIGRGYTLIEIIGGKYGPGGQIEWEPIRGAPNEIERIGVHPSRLFSEFSIQVELVLEGEKTSYSIGLGGDLLYPNGFRVLREDLHSSSATFFATVDDATVYEKYGDTLIHLKGEGDAADGSGGFEAKLGRNQPVLTQLAGMPSRMQPPILPATHWALGGIRFLDLSPVRMREPSIPGANTLGDYGQNLPSALEAICADSERGSTLMSWLQELTPMDVKDFDFPRDPSGRVHLHIVERNGRKISSYSASDGTLRFLAILAALLSPRDGGLYFFEEIDNGIHPNRLWLLVDFIERQTAKGGVQVITTTHSPALLSWMNDTTFEHTSVVYRDQYWADSVIRPMAGLYNLGELRKSVTLGELHTEGWMEQAMKASEGDSDTDHLDDDEDDWQQGTLK